MSRNFLLISIIGLAIGLFTAGLFSLTDTSGKISSLLAFGLIAAAAKVYEPAKQWQTRLSFGTLAVFFLAIFAHNKIVEKNINSALVKVINGEDVQLSRLEHGEMAELLEFVIEANKHTETLDKKLTLNIDAIGWLDFSTLESLEDSAIREEKSLHLLALQKLISDYKDAYNTYQKDVVVPQVKGILYKNDPNHAAQTWKAFNETYSVSVSLTHQMIALMEEKVALQLQFLTLLDYLEGHFYAEGGQLLFENDDDLSDALDAIQLIVENEAAISEWLLKVDQRQETLLAKYSK